MDIDIKKIRFLESIDEIGPHDHLCLIYENHEEQMGAIAPFVKNGLKRNERCVYIADENSAEDVSEVLRAIDEDVFGLAMREGSFSVLSQQETYFKGGYFSPEKMIGLLDEGVNEAISSGFTGLRATGEMTWMFGGNPGSDKMMEYEMKLNDYLPTHNICAICQYNRNRFSDELLLQVFQSHPKVIYKNQIIKNPLYLSSGDTDVLIRKMRDVFAC
jgi:hypothetical protein